MTASVRSVLAACLVLSVACAGGRKERREGRGEGGQERAQAEKRERVEPRADGPRVPATPEGLLGGKAVREVQRALVRKGLLGAHREGDLDTATSAAVRKFQEQQGLAATNMPDRETLRALGVSAERAYGAGPDGG